jgi:hypothetical protein
MSIRFEARAETGWIMVKSTPVFWSRLFIFISQALTCRKELEHTKQLIGKTGYIREKVSVFVQGLQRWDEKEEEES